MADSDQSLEKDLTGVRGWLLLYAIGPAGFGVIAALVQAAELWRYGGDELEWLIGIALFLAYSTGLYMLIAARNPFTRLYRSPFKSQIFHSLVPTPGKYFTI